MSPDIRNVLNSVIKAELNMLYTESPSMTNKWSDLGLFCREHAYHTYFLCRLSGYPVEIKLGHFIIIPPHGGGISTLYSGADHAWCTSEALKPIDLSMTFHYIEGFPEIDHPVLGTGQNGPYTISYMFNEFLFRKYHDDPPDLCSIYYLEVETFPANDEILLKNPFIFLHRSPIANKSWTDAYGHDIFAKITLHLYEIALGNIKPLHEQMNAHEAINIIKSKYPSAFSALRAEIAKKMQSPNKVN